MAGLEMINGKRWAAEAKPPGAGRSRFNGYLATCIFIKKQKYKIPLKRKGFLAIIFIRPGEAAFSH